MSQKTCPELEPKQVPKTIVPSRAGEQARMKKRVQSSGSL